MQIYKRIRDLREDADKTQRDIANQLYMQLEVYRRYETGQRMPPFDFIIEDYSLEGKPLVILGFSLLKSARLSDCKCA